MFLIVNLESQHLRNGFEIFPSPIGNNFVEMEILIDFFY